MIANFQLSNFLSFLLFLSFSFVFVRMQLCTCPFYLHTFIGCGLKHPCINKHLYKSVCEWKECQNVCTVQQCALRSDREHTSDKRKKVFPHTLLDDSEVLRVIINSTYTCSFCTQHCFAHKHLANLPNQHEHEQSQTSAEV